MNSIKYETGSFRDPSGRIFYKDNKVYREISSLGKDRYEFIKNNEILDESIKKGYVIKTKEITDKDLESKLSSSKLILEHEAIKYISFPYEWCFYQLKEAALHHLSFQLYLLEKNAILIDSSAYNIQFSGNKPLFIDVLSIDKYKEGMYWTGHKQFCENFLNPLLLSSKKNIYFNNWFKGNLEGIFTSDLNSLLNFKDKFSLNIFLQVYLLNKLENKTIRDPYKVASKLKKIRPFAKKSYKSLLNQIKNMIEKLHPFKKETLWSKYSEINTYSKKDESSKIEIVKKFNMKNNFNLLADIGCNDGVYSFESLNSGCKYVVGFDQDLNSVNKAFLKARQKNSAFLPLFFDASNPSSNLGWHENERAGFKKRINFDGMLALAFEHHLTISKNIPLDSAIDWLTNIAPKGLIEFVPKEDKNVQAMMSLKGDIFPDYNEEKFKYYLEKRAKIIAINKFGDSGRKIYEYSKV